MNLVAWWAAKNIGEIYRKTNLAADPRARHVFAAEQAKRQGQAVADGVLTTDQKLQLTTAESATARKAAIGLHSKSEAGSKVAQDRQTSGIDVATGGGDPQHARARVPGEQIAEVRSNSGFVRKRLLGDEVQPVIREARTELLGGVSGRKLDVQAGPERRNL